MRGDRVSRDIGDVMAEAERLKNAGVRELLIISQDTSAYGVNIRFQYASQKILKSMKRPAASENNLTRI